ncbi:MAG: radical SAM/SPASM domain-containing protein [Candidatus Hydrogenedentota bacterium]
MRYNYISIKDSRFPKMVVVEVCNICNFRCLHCGYRKIINDRRYKPCFLDFKIYKKVVNEVLKYKNSFLRFTSDGEPLMHPEFINMVRYAKNSGCYPLTVNTNGMLLTGEKSKELLDAGIDIVEVSLNAFRKETYNKLRIGGDYDTVIENINKLIRYRNKNKYKTKIMVSMIDSLDIPGYNEEILEFKRYWAKRVDKIIMRKFFDQQGLVDINRSRKHKIMKDRYPCPQLWKRITVSSNGWLKYCVNDWFNLTAIADLRNKEVFIYRVWNSEEYKEMRKNQIAGKYDRMNMCGSCTDWKAMDWEYDYNYAVERLINEKKN